MVKEVIDFKKSTLLKDKLASLRPLKELDIRRLRNDERVEMVHASNALEGNTLTISETQWILEKGMTVDGKSMREHLEVVNLNEAIDYVEDLVRGDEKLDERTLKQIHYLVYNKLAENKRLAGNYRNINVRILGSEHIPPDFMNVNDEIKKMFEWSDHVKAKLHPIEYAAQLHEKFVAIHPFADGNGRTARLLMNFALTNNGYPPIIVKPDKESRERYIEALEHGHLTGDNTPFVKIVKKLVDNKMMEMIKQVELSRRYQESSEEGVISVSEFEEFRENLKRRGVEKEQ